MVSRPGARSLPVVAGTVFGASADALGAGLGCFHALTPSKLQFLLTFAALWLNFGTTIRPSLRWMWRRPALAAVLGAVAGPLAYLVAARIGAIDFGESTWKGLGWLAVQYGAAIPLWLLAFRRLFSAPDAAAHRSSASGATP
ncbi:MAG: DUF2878 family protein [Phycisphaerales bacterium]|nr:DUF2878 family protein [Phycisphaerales bacterium]